MKRKLLRLLSVIILVLLVGYAVGALLAQPAQGHPIYAGDIPRPLVIAHQGGDGLWPGDTMFAYERAAAMGVDMLEMDIHMTVDGVIVLMHDATVDRTTDGSGEIREMTLVQLQALDAGYDWSPEGEDSYPYRGQGIRAPALEELFQSFPDMLMNIEIKQAEPSLVVPLCNLIREYDKENEVLVASFRQEAMDEFRQVCPEVATSGAEAELTPFVIMSLAYLGPLTSPDYVAVQVPEERSGIHILAPRFVRAAHNRNLWVDAWTINETDDMERLIAMGVDGIITDRPDRLLALLGR